MCYQSYVCSYQIKAVRALFNTSVRDEKITRKERATFGDWWDSSVTDQNTVNTDHWFSMLWKYASLGVQQQADCWRGGENMQCILATVLLVMLVEEGWARFSVRSRRTCDSLGWNGIDWESGRVIEAWREGIPRGGKREENRKRRRRSRYLTDGPSSGCVREFLHTHTSIDFAICDYIYQEKKQSDHKHWME